jgi:hypothetical protein
MNLRALLFCESQHFVKRESPHRSCISCLLLIIQSARLRSSSSLHRCRRAMKSENEQCTNDHRRPKMQFVFQALTPNTVHLRILTPIWEILSQRVP